MKEPLFALDYLLWLSSVLLEMAILAAMASRHRVRRHPAFATFLAFCLARSAVLFVVASTSTAATYFYWYYGLYSVGSILSLAIVRECVLRVFEPFDGLPTSTLSRLTKAAFVVGIAAIGIAVVAHTGDPGGYAIMALARTYDIAASLISITVLVLIVAYARWLGLPVRSLTYAISAGFVFYSAVQVVVTYILARSSPEVAFVVRPLGPAAFVIAECVWFAQVLQREAVPLRPSPEVLAEVTRIVQKYRTALCPELVRGTRAVHTGPRQERG